MSDLLANRDENRSGRPTRAYDRPGQTFFLNGEGLGFFRSLFSLKGQAIQKASHAY